MKRTALVPVLCLTAALAACPACVKKCIGVRSDPPGATVYLDGLEVGTTPVDHVPFEFYGTREIAVFKDGYLCERRTVDIDTPWYSCFPFDLVSELLLPYDLRDHRLYYFRLRRTEHVDRETLLRHARQTRDIGRARIEGSRRAAAYRPRAYVVEGRDKPFVLWGPFVSPPRGEPICREPEEKPKEADETE